MSLIDKVTDGSGNVVKDFGSEKESSVDVLSSSQWAAIHSGMRQVVQNLSTFDNFPVEVAGKTGTAQESKKRPNHALFISYAPYDSPRFSCAVRIPYGYTSHNAADVAKNILGVCFNIDEYKNMVGSGAAELSTTNARAD